MKFELPESLKELSLDDLSDLEAAALSQHQTLAAIDDAELTDEQVAALEYSVDAVKQIRAERKSREAAAAKETRAQAAKSALAEEAPPAEVVEAAPESTEEASVEPPSESTEGTTTTTEEASEQTVTASTSPVESLVNRGKRPQLPTKDPITIIAAADVPRHATGSALEGLEGVTKAFNERLKTLPKQPMGGPGKRVFNRYGVATFSRRNFDGLVDTNPDFGGDAMKLLREASRESRLPNGSLTAAGGWCAPSETIYDLCALESTDGLVDLPEVNITRGGIRFTQGPDFSEIFSSVGFCQTEAEAEAGETKPCFDVPCPDFEEERLDACGLCIRAGILTNVGYPELVERWISGSMIAHQHRMSAKVINEIEAALGAPVLFSGAGGAAGIISNVEAVINGQREAFRMPMGATLEVLAPFWLRSVIRADLAFRNGVDLINVTDAQIDAYFAVRGARIQWLYNWQGLGNRCAEGYPETVELLIYPAGTFVKGVEDVIQLDAVYDSAGLQTNTYTALFFEEGILVAKVCHGGCRVSMPVCISGQTGAPDLTACQLAGTGASS